MSGILEGGWAYVYAAYALTWLLLGGYAVYLWTRTPRDPGGPR
jgi:hypothetical protein